MSTAQTLLPITPTLDQVRDKWVNDLQLVGLHTLAEAARSTRPADYIAAILDTVRDSYHPREVTYLSQFIMHHAEQRGLLSLPRAS
jgi:hypothetical protein